MTICLHDNLFSVMIFKILADLLVVKVAVYYGVRSYGVRYLASNFVPFVLMVQSTSACTSIIFRLSKKFLFYRSFFWAILCIKWCTYVFT